MKYNHLKYRSSNSVNNITKIFVFFILFVCQHISAQKMLEKKDQYTGETVYYQEAKKLENGTPISKDFIDGVIYRYEDGIYYKRVIDGAVNVKWFGAKGDGNKDDLGTDDTNAIDNAIKSLAKIYKTSNITGGNLLGGCTLYFPPGKYLVNKTFILPNNFIIKGSSENNTIIHAIKPRFIFTNVGGFYANGVDMIMNEGITISDLTLKQGGVELQQAVSSRLENLRIINLFGSGTDTGISIKLATDLRIKNVKIYGSTGFGIKFQETLGGKLSTTTSFEDVWISHCNVGMLVDGADGKMGIVSSNVVNSIFEYNKVGMQIKGRVTNFSLRDTHFEQNSVNALEVDGNINLILDNVWGDNVGGIKIMGNAKNQASDKIYIRNSKIPYEVDRKYGGKITVD